MPRGSENAKTPMPQALIVDDEPNTLAAMSEIVELEGFATTSVGTLADARAAIESQAPDLLLMDLMLPDGQSLELLKDLNPAQKTEVILITGNATMDSAIDALRLGVLDYLTKPVDTNRLRTILRNVSRTMAYKEEIGALRSELRSLGRFARLIGNSPAMQHVYDLVAKVATTDVTVFLTGESGTGKEEVAATIHELSRRRKHPFLPLNCGAVSPQLIESELFGHERGSFTGANQLHHGYFERCSGGTLFLDEVTEMPLELQVRLLRVLETGKLVRVGGNQPISVDVRVIAASNRSPEAAVAEGKFREDLYYRLNVFPIALPPLRDREGDIELLAEFFLDRLNRAENTQKKFSPTALRNMAGHNWPGNVRELKNMIQRSFIMADQTLDIGPLSHRSGGAASVDGGGGLDGIKVGSTVADAERLLILATFEQCSGDKKKAAEILGISLKTLYNRLNLYAAAK
jgi:DNA-binding NtrC family response regulator